MPTCSSRLRKTFAGASLDVFAQEPLPPDHPLLALDNTVLVPHIGYVTREQYVVRYRETVENIVAYLKGTPTRVRNPEVLNQAAHTARNADARS